MTEYISRLPSEHIVYRLSFTSNNNFYRLSSIVPLVSFVVPNLSLEISRLSFQTTKSYGTQQNITVVERQI